MGTADRRVSAACAVSAVLGATALAATLAPGADPWRRPALLVAFTLALVATQFLPFQLWSRDQAEEFQLEEALFVPMAVFLTPGELLVSFGVALAVYSVRQHQGLAKSTFNIGQTLAGAGAGLAVSRLLGATTGDASLASVGAAFVGGFVYAVLTTVAVAFVLSLVQRERFRDVFADGAPPALALVVGSLSLGVLVALAAGQNGWSALVVVVPVALLQYAYAGALGQWRERRRAEALYDATASIRGTVRPDEVRERSVDAARRLLQAEDARFVERDEPLSADALRGEVDEAVALDVRGRVGGGAWEASDSALLRALGAAAAGALANADLFERLRAITTSLGEGVLAVDADARISFANPAAERMLGWSEADLVGRSLHETVHFRRADGSPRPAEQCPLRVVLATGETVRDDDDVLVRKDAEVLPVAFTASPVLREGSPIGAVVALRDVTERKAFERELTRQAFTDSLTGLPNRALFLDRLAHAHRRALRSGATHALLFVDLDRFKVVNDSLGHGVGDRLLTIVAQRLRTEVRDGDTFARLGGDEFTVLVEDVVSAGQAVDLARRLLEALRPPFVVDGRELYLTASIGVALNAEGRVGPDDLLSCADIALYRAKGAGKDRYEVFDPRLQGETLERLDLEMALRSAVERHELELYYQPILSAETGELVGAEALVRWNHPTRGLIGPGAFIDLAEETGLILPVGRWVLEEACRQTRSWQDAGRHLSVSVNLSARQFHQADLRSSVAEVLATTGLPAASLCLEITESVLVEDADSAGALTALKDLGVRLAIDDFGTGYSSLAYLKNFPVDVVKIDRSFVEGLGEDNSVDTEIVNAVIRLTRAVGMNVVAEGVSTSGQLDRLRDLDCPLVQGFHLARPLTVAALGRLLDDQPSPPAVVDLRRA